MPRLLFEKKGNAVWISHLDLMRLFQRAFKRAGLKLTHTQGFNPRPSVSIALPLSVGIESACELLDFDLDGEPIPVGEIASRLNPCLVDGVGVLDVYEKGRKLRDLSLLSCSVFLEYDNGVPAGAEAAIRELFSRDELIVSRKTKSGMQDQNIVSMIRRMDLGAEGDHMIRMNALICCQNPSLNPGQISQAVQLYLPQFAPDFSRCVRNEIYDNDETVFR